MSDFVRQHGGQLVGGNYELEGFLARGGMGEVYKAHHVHLNVPCVIKVMRPALREEQGLHDRFAREARLARRLQHSNVAMLYDFSVLPDGTYYMVWEYIDGPNVSQLIQREGALPVRRALQLTIDAAEGLEAIHRAGIVHRDISPDNILIAHSGAKIIDLGIAKGGGDTGNSHTATGVFVGKLRYASPEQLGALNDDERIDGRSDLYSLGLVFYEMLAGKPAFVATSAHRYFALQLHEPPPPLALTGVPEPARIALLAAIAGATAKPRNARPHSAHAFAETLRGIVALLDGHPATSTDVVIWPAEPQDGAPTVGTTAPALVLEAPPTSPSHRRRRPAVRWWSASAAAALLFATITFLMLRTRDAAAPPVSTSSAPVVQAAIADQRLPEKPKPAPVETATSPAVMLAAPLVSKKQDKPLTPPPAKELVRPAEPEPPVEETETAPEVAAATTPPVTPPPVLTNRAEADLRPGRHQNWRRRVRSVHILRSFDGSAYDHVLIAPLETGATQVLPEPSNDVYGYRQAAFDLLGSITSVFADAYRQGSRKTVQLADGAAGSGSLLIEVKVVRLQAGSYVFNVIGPTLIEVEGVIRDAASGTPLVEFTHVREYSPALPGLTWNKRPRILKEKTQQVAADIAALVEAF